jgi:CelD/BcsL family acetyltransferase involved in cellulose biosynthesis
MIDTELIVDAASLAEIEGQWDALAVACGLPLMAPAWVLAWWAHLAPATAQPRVVAVRDRKELIGLAPFFVEPDARVARVDYRLPGIELSARLAPLALPGREWEVAAALGEALAHAEPRPDVVALEGTPVASHWPLALRETWPGTARAVVRHYNVYGCPVVSLRDRTYEGWLNRKSPHFRARARRVRRQFEAAGGTIRLSTRETLRADIDTLLRLHAERWRELGSSKLVELGEARVAAMFAQAGEALLAQGRFRLQVAEIGELPIAAHLAVQAGGEVLTVNGGWDPRFAELSLTMVSTLRLVEDAIERGDRRIDLGLGEQGYKQRIADGSDPVVWSVLLAPRARLPLTLARTAPPSLRDSARKYTRRTLSAEQLDRLRAMRRRLRG